MQMIAIGGAIGAGRSIHLMKLCMSEHRQVCSSDQAMLFKQEVQAALSSGLL